MIGEDHGSIDSVAAIDAVGPNQFAKAFEMKATIVSRRGVGFVAANESWIKNYGEKIIGYVEDGEGVRCWDRFTR